GFHFRGIDVLASADDEVAAPRVHDEPAARIQLAQIPGAKKAFSQRRLTEVAAHHRRAANDDLSSVDEDLESGQWAPRRHTLGIVWPLAGRHRAGLRHPPGLYDAKAGASRALEQRLRHRPAAHGDDDRGEGRTMLED